MYRRASAFIPYLFLMAGTLFIFSPLVADPDLWGHVRFGQDTLLTGQIVRADPYSYLTAGQRWINHEWLTEVIYALAYNAATARGLIALNSLLGLLIVTLVYTRLRRAGMDAVGAILLTVGSSLVLRPAVLNVRPQLFTYLLFLLLLLLVDAYSERPNFPGGQIGFPAAICLVLALWANLHGGVLAGLGVLYLWGLIYIGQGVLRSRSIRAIGHPPQRAVLLTLLLAPLALLFNPYGPDLPAFLMRTATVARPEILEWSPARLDDLWSQYWLIAAALTLVAMAVTRRPRRLALVVPLAVIALLPLTAVRHIPLFAVAAPVLAADHFADLWDRLVKLIPARTKPGPVATRSAKLLSGAAAVVLVILSLPRLQRIVIQPSSAGFPVGAVAVLKAAGVHANMATEFNWGEYAIWQLGPRVQVSVDGRRETIYSEAVYQENLDFMRGEGQWDRLVDRPETEIALVDRERAAFNLMQNKTRWLLAYEDRTAALFVRSGGPLQAAIAKVIPPEWPTDGGGLAFPVE